MQLILASQSPRRRELMGLFSLPFVIRTQAVDETMTPGEDPRDGVARLSRSKAMAVAREPEDTVIGADTVVVCQGKVLGKPRNPEEAVEMLSLLSGRTHTVMTGLTVCRGTRCVTVTEVTEIRFRSLSREEIERYVRTGEPLDKAGAYGIQGGGALFVEHIRGDYYNVVGLPVCRLWQLLRQVAPEWMEDTQ